MRVGHSFRLAAAALVLASVAVAGRPAFASVTAVPSGTITYGEAPGANPNFIFPFMGCAYASVNNINQFQMLMFRPLYWFGLGGVGAVRTVALTRRSRRSSRTMTIR